MTQVMIDAMWEEFRETIMTFEENEVRLEYAKIMFIGGVCKAVDAVTTLASLRDQEQAKQLFDDLREELLAYHPGSDE